MAEGDHQGIVAHHWVAIAVFAGDFDRTAKANNIFEPVFRDQAGMIAGATGNDLNLLDLFKGVFGRSTKTGDIDLLVN